jgi:hypothetical protein
MILPAGPLRVYVATRPVDFRKGLDGLAALAQEQLRLDPFSGAVLVFRAKRLSSSLAPPALSQDRARRASCRSAADTRIGRSASDAAAPEADMPHAVWQERVRRRPPPWGAFTRAGAASGSAEVSGEAGRYAGRQGLDCRQP